MLQAIIPLIVERLLLLKFTADPSKDVLEAQVIWQQAYSSHIDAKVEYKVSLANYEKAMGEIK
jgi:hypothetical protein